MDVLLFYLLLALVISSLCSIAEAVLLSIDLPFTVSLEKRRPRVAKWLSDFKQKPDRALSAILTLNTVAHTAGAAGVGHQAVVVFGDSSLAIASAVMTLLILVVSEIIPKTIGAAHWKRLAVPVAIATQRLCVLLAPVLAGLQFITDRFSRRQHGPGVSLEEIESLAILGKKSGVLTAEQSLILANLFKIEKVRIEKIMTPRLVTLYLPDSTTVGEYRTQFAKSPHSRIPITGEDGGITGFVLRMDLLSCRDESRTLGDFTRPLLAFSEHYTVKAGYRALMKDRQQMAEVVDEFGQFSGVVTMEDIVETILGAEIVDESDTHDNLREKARRDHRRKLGGASPGGAFDLLESDDEDRSVATGSLVR